MELKSRLKDYKTEMLWVIFLALVLIILAFALDTSLDLTHTESLLLNLLIGFVGLIISVVIILRKAIESSVGSIKAILKGIGEIKQILTRPIPEELSPPLKDLVKSEKDDYTKAYNILTKGGRYIVDKQEMYQNLIKFAGVMSTKNNDEILAVSSVDILDLQKDPYAMAYRVVNEECAKNGVHVKRIFLLSNDLLKTRDAVNLVKKHGEELSEVKWLNKRFLNINERDQDFAIFNDCILVEQKRAANRYEIIISDSSLINDAKRTFRQIWDDSNAKPWSTIEDEWRRMRGR